MTYDYNKSTIDSPNLLRRFSHRQRLKKSLKGIDLSKEKTLLDYGCGNGLFLMELHKKYPDSQLFGYEPYPDSYSPDNNLHTHINLFYSKSDLDIYLNKNIKFDYITCFEVLEHCHVSVQNQIFENFKNLIKGTGIIIISVPIEIGPPSLIKNIFRFRMNPKRRFIGYTFKNILKSFVYSLPIKDYRNKKEFLTHMGFDFRKLENKIKEHFNIIEISYSPFKKVNHWCNSQVFYRIKLK